MDVVTLALAKQYTNSQRVAYTDPAKVFTFDGDRTGKVVTELVTGKYVRISDVPMDFKTVTKITSQFHPVLAAAFGIPEKQELTAESLTVKDESYDGNEYQLLGTDDGYFAISITSNPVDIPLGLYVMCGTFGEQGIELDGIDPNETAMWVSSVEFPETIHPIDPKFIPPMDSLTLNGADGKRYKLSVDENGQLVTAVVE